MNCKPGDLAYVTNSATHFTTRGMLCPCLRGRIVKVKTAINGLVSGLFEANGWILEDPILCKNDGNVVLETIADSVLRPLTPPEGTVITDEELEHELQSR